MKSSVEPACTHPVPRQNRAEIDARQPRGARNADVGPGRRGFTIRCDEIGMVSQNGCGQWQRNRGRQPA